MNISTAAPMWAAASADLTRLAGQLSTRRDLVVSVTQDGVTAPMGLFHRHTAQITLNADRLFAGLDPATLTFSDARTRADNPLTLGLLLHELGHAEHTFPRGQQHPRIAEWASLLEEPRIERCMVDRHPMARRWLRTSAARVALGDMGTREAAAVAAVLVIGRIQAGILTAREVDAVSTVMDKHFAGDDKAAITAVINTAVDLADNDIGGLIDCAETLERLVNGPDRGSLGPRVEHTHDDATGVRQEVPAQSDQEAGRLHVQMKAAADTRKVRHGPTVRSVRRPSRPVGVYGTPTSAIHTSRPATAYEYARAATLSKALRTASSRPPTTSMAPSNAPPGQLSGVELVQWSAQRSQGALRTAQPWGTPRRRISAPASLAVAVIVDQSDSMEAHLPEVGAVAWTVQEAVNSLPGSHCRLWTFSSEATPVPRHPDRNVQIPLPAGGSDGLPAAIELAREWLAKQATTDRVILVLTDEGLPNSSEVLTAFCAANAHNISAVWATPEADMRVDALSGQVAHVPWSTEIKAIGALLVSSVSR